MKDEQVRSHEESKIFYGLVAVAFAAFAIVLVGLFWSDQSNARRLLREAGLQKPTSTRCADQELAVYSAEAREQVENAELRRRIQIINATIADNSTSSATTSELNGELSALRDKLMTSRSYQDLDAARETFYDCERAGEE